MKLLQPPLSRSPSFDRKADGNESDTVGSPHMHHDNICLLLRHHLEHDKNCTQAPLASNGLRVPDQLQYFLTLWHAHVEFQ